MSKRNGNTGLKALAAIMSGLFILLAVAGVVFAHFAMNLADDYFD